MSVNISVTCAAQTVRNGLALKGVISILHARLNSLAEAKLRTPLKSHRFGDEPNWSVANHVTSAHEFESPLTSAYDLLHVSKYFYDFLHFGKLCNLENKASV